MPGWQQWYASRRGADVELVSVAVDMGGEAAVRLWTDRAGAQFPTVIDVDNRLGAILGFQAIPNGVLLDPQGVIRYAKFGGFDVNRPDDLQAVEAAMKGADGASVSGKQAALSTAEQERVADLLHTGTAKLQAGEREAGLASWREALRLDPENFIIRKQLWRADHPERFGETIDMAWQQRQLAEEKAQEASGRG